MAYDAASPSMVVREARILMIHKFSPRSLYSLDLYLQHQDSSLLTQSMQPGPGSRGTITGKLPYHEVCTYKYDFLAKCQQIDDTTKQN